MKKIILICLLIVMLLSACNKEQLKNVITTSTTETTVIFTTKEPHERKTQNNIEELVSDNFFDSLKVGSKSESQPLTTYFNSETLMHHEPPYMVHFTLESFADFKNAYGTMSNEDFAEFLMNADDEYYYENCIENNEEAKAVIDIVENTTIVLLDGKKENFYEITLYIESDYLVQPIVLTENKNLVCRYYPKQNEKGFASSFADTEKAVFIKDVTANGVTAKVYDYDGELNAEMIVNDTRIAYRVTEVQTIEEFEADFARLKFVKIGDLLNE